MEGAFKKWTHETGKKKDVRMELYVLDNERFILSAAVFLASRLQAQGSCQMSCGASGTEDLEMH